MHFSATAPSHNTVPSLGRRHCAQPQALSLAQLNVTMPRPVHCHWCTSVPPCLSSGPVLHCPAPVTLLSMAQFQCAPSWALSPTHIGATMPVTCWFLLVSSCCCPVAASILIVSVPFFVGNWNYFGWGEQQSKYPVPSSPASLAVPSAAPFAMLQPGLGLRGPGARVQVALCWVRTEAPSALSWAGLSPQADGDKAP